MLVIWGFCKKLFKFATSEPEEAVKETYPEISEGFIELQKEQLNLFSKKKHYLSGWFACNNKCTIRHILFVLNWQKRLKTNRYAKNPANFTALGKMLEPNEVADVIEFLCSKRSSGITGTNIVVDAGWHIASSWAQFGGVRER